MKRRTFKLCLFLLLGAIINVAVAWGCACFVTRHFGDPMVAASFSGTAGWEVMVFSLSGAECFSSTFGRQPVEGRKILTPDVDPSALFPRWSKPHLEPIVWPYPPQSVLLLGQASGWPCLAMRSYRKGTFDRLDLTDGYSISRSGAAVYRFADARSMQRGVLPLGIIWPGFAINTIFYAAMLWLLFAAPFQLRRFRRIKRGLCLKCAYPIGTSDVCTECGAQLPLPLGEGRGEGMRASK